MVAWFTCHGVVGCSKVGDRGRHIEVVLAAKYGGRRSMRVDDSGGSRVCVG